MKTTPEKARAYINALPQSRLAAIVADVLNVLALVQEDENAPLVLDDQKEFRSCADACEEVGRALIVHGVTLEKIEAFNPVLAPIGPGSMTIYNSRRDFAGNCSHAFAYYDHKSGRTICATVGAQTTANTAIFYMNGGTWDPQPSGAARPIAVTESELGIREFNKLVRGWPDFGCVPQEVAEQIRAALHAIQVQTEAKR